MREKQIKEHRWHLSTLSQPNASFHVRSWNPSLSQSKVAKKFTQLTLPSIKSFFTEPQNSLFLSLSLFLPVYPFSHASLKWNIFICLGTKASQKLFHPLNRLTHTRHESSFLSFCEKCLKYKNSGEYASFTDHRGKHRRKNLHNILVKQPDNPANCLSGTKLQNVLAPLLLCWYCTPNSEYFNPCVSMSNTFTKYHG